MTDYDIMRMQLALSVAVNALRATAKQIDYVTELLSGLAQDEPIDAAQVSEQREHAAMIVHALVLLDRGHTL